MLETTNKELIVNNDEELFDFIFIGLGASNSLIVLSLFKKGLLTDRKVAVIESDSKKNNDKTYCFWAMPNDEIVEDLQSIISHRYTKIQVNQSASQCIQNQPYYYIRSIDLYNFVESVLSDMGVPVLRQNADVIKINGDISIVSTTAGNEFQAKYIFDSRPPTIKKLPANDVYINQSFYGLHIRCKTDVFDEDAFEMMNFDVDQHQFTQFTYVLPFSSKEALIELTRFGSELIDLDYAKSTLEKMLVSKFGEFEIIDQESGCIPMTTYIHPKSAQEGIIYTGSGANLIKPSTGYGFKNMHQYAGLVSSCIANKSNNKLHKLTIKTASRFLFYDSLLLIILFKWPQHGKRIFSDLFKNHNIHTIFSFLDGRTKIAQELQIFATLPIVPFLEAIVTYVGKSRFMRFVFVIGCSVAYYISVNNYQLLATYFANAVCISGLIIVGLPHGALDHLLLGKLKLSLFSFILSYLLIALSFFVFWQFFPLFSLIIFIAYSSFHFGESEYIEAKSQTRLPFDFLRAFLLGFAILAFIIFSHLGESILVVSSLEGLQSLNNIGQYVEDYKIFVCLLSFLYVLIVSLVGNKLSYYSLVCILLLGVNMPLIFAFLLYFICQHSTNAWGHLKKRLSIDSFNLYKKALPATIGALLLIGSLFIYRSVEWNYNEYVFGQFFVFLACVSLPHFILMHLFYKRIS